MVSARLSVDLITRLDFLTRNHDGVKNRSQGIESAVKAYIEAREKELQSLGVIAGRP